ncbi:ROK family protein [Paenibacillus xerothermodurans]|uniref:ROK family protein n=1 Tax=Paenibacillus xerothermodurans TaxID=1977292 RepID=A0A2W1NNV8_PAEXE|nr:ROK family protein [Paenibacillus xerothermodurans]PZE21155.1 ROK family protein [Paenibacillus xerothermodurans]
MALAVGIDIGGTKVSVGVVDQEGRVVAKSALKTDLTVPPGHMVARIAESVNGMMAEHGWNYVDMMGIGIGAPGPLDPKAGKITCPPNLPSWKDFTLAAELQKRLPCDIRLENDATAATLAEKWLGAARETDHFVYLTISTGIGAGIYLHGKLITGATGNAGDAGHIVVDPAAGQCTCGQYGCWEQVASGTAIARQASELRGKPVTAKQVFELADQGDSEMLALVNKVYRYVGVGCVSLINLLDPDMIVIGGGVSQVGAPLFQAVQQYVSRHALNPSGRETAVVPAVLDQDAGLIGAAALIHREYA